MWPKVKGHPKIGYFGPKYGYYSTFWPIIFAKYNEIYLLWHSFTHWNKKVKIRANYNLIGCLWSCDLRSKVIKRSSIFWKFHKLQIIFLLKNVYKKIIDTLIKYVHGVKFTFWVLQSDWLKYVTWAEVKRSNLWKISKIEHVWSQIWKIFYNLTSTHIIYKFLAFHRYITLVPTPILSFLNF